MIQHFYLKDQCVARIFLEIINYYVFQGMGGVSYPHPFLVIDACLYSPYFIENYTLLIFLLSIIRIH